MIKKASVKRAISSFIFKLVECEKIVTENIHDESECVLGFQVYIKIFWWNFCIRIRTDEQIGDLGYEVQLFQNTDYVGELEERARHLRFSHKI